MSSGDARSAPNKVPRPAALNPSTAPKKPERPAPRRSEPPPRSPLDPSVLVIGADEMFLPALRVALTRHRVHVETTTLDQAVETVVVAAPDLILLAGDAAKEAGHELLKHLTSSQVSSVIPVALLSDDVALDERLKAFRHGAAAVIPRSASIDAVAEEIARLAREIPERGGDALGQIGEATLEEFVNALSSELRSGILSVKQGEGQTPVRLVLGSGRPLAAFIDDFVTRVRRHVVRAEPLHYEFDERAGGTVQFLPGETRGSEPPPSNIKHLRLLLADDEPARTDVVAQELRARGAEVAVTALDPQDADFGRLRHFDPEVVIVGERELAGAGYTLLRRMKRDTRLRWASLLVVRWQEILDPALGIPIVDKLTGPLATLAEADRGLADRAELGDGFDARLEVNGPARCLRALAASGRALRISVQNPRLTVEVDVSDGLIVGASATAPTGERWEGGKALSALLVLSSGRVHVEPAAQPATTNLMSPVDAALNLAERESAPIAPSLPAGAGPSDPPAAPAAEIPTAPAVPREAVPHEPARRASVSSITRSPFLATSRATLSPKRKGISGPFAAVLLGLGIAQGLLIPVGVYYFRRSSRDSAQSPPATTSAVTAAPLARASAVAPKPSAAPSALPSEAASASAAPPAEVPLPSPTAGLGPDESGARAPTCEELLPSGPNAGDFPGAAYEQLKIARRAIVQGKADDAQRAYCTALRWDAKNPVYYLELAQLLLIRRDGAGAAEWARQAVRLDPTSTKAQSLVGDGLARTGDAEGARRAWYAAFSVNTPSPKEIEQLSLRSLKEADQALSARDYVRAERFYRRGALLDPKSAVARRGLATALLRLGEGQNALRWARAAVELGAADPLAQIALGDALVATGDKNAARAAFEEAERLGYTDARRRLERLAKP
ncbi:MAG TPA: tetratricopeptide repeat protein [Polyangiaceae bacterium]|nr:tetratricopeptide repeat protein [Polyangiaceae bacterium]